MPAWITLRVHPNRRFEFIVPDYPQHQTERGREDWQRRVDSLIMVDPEERHGYLLSDCLTVGGAKTAVRWVGCLLEVSVHGYAQSGCDIVHWCRVTGVDPAKAKGHIDKAVLAMTLEQLRR